MNEKILNRYLTGALALALLLMTILGAFIGATVNRNAVLTQQMSQMVNAPAEVLAIEVNGTMRLETAKVNGTLEDGEAILEDSTGELWGVYDSALTRGAKVLILIDDSGTPDTTLDDVIVRLWKNEK